MSALQDPNGPAIILASGSPTRARLLRAAGLRFTISVPTVDEASYRESLAAEGVATADAAVALAELKARRVAAGAGDAIVLGADLLLELDGAWLAKADDRAAARAQLQRLRGRSHRLAAACVAFRGAARVWHHVETVEVAMRDVSDTALDAYLDVAGDAVLGSVGAYHLEEAGAQLIARIHGDHFAVLGLPLLPLLQCLRDQGVLLR